MSKRVSIVNAGLVVRPLRKLRIVWEGYKLARRHGYGIMPAYRFGRMALFEHPISRKKKSKRQY